MMLSVRSKGRPASAGRVLFVVLACVCLAEASSLTRRRPARIASSTVSPFSRDGRYLLLRHESGFGLYDAEGRFLRNLPRQIDAGAEPRWSSREPSVLYYLNGNQLRSVDVDTGEATLVRLFDEYGSVRG